MIKHRIIVGLGMLLCVGVVTFARGDDLFPPEWRGGPNSTLQIWEFNTGANPALPTSYANPYGTPEATIFGEFNLPMRDTLWLAEDLGHQGVWNIGGAMSFDIPNDPVLRPFKYIRLQITYDGGTTPEPQPRIDVYADNGATVIESEFVGRVILDQTYVHDTYDFVLQPNPSHETIWVQPRYCQIYVDEVVIDTICVPEPSTLVTLLIGAMACVVLRKRFR